MLTVLIAEDESIERNYLYSLFQKRPELYRVAALAENGEQAVELSARLRPDISILDISMPLMDGLEAARRIRQDAPEQIVILNSAYADFEFARQAVTYGLDGYLLKPAQEDAIFETISACLYRRSRPGRIICSELPDTTMGSYPHGIVDRILEAIKSNNLSQLKKNATLYIDAIKERQGDLESCRLFVLNTIFTTEQSLRRRGTSEETLNLLASSRALSQIGRAVSWGEIRSISEEFFSRLLLLIRGQEQTPLNAVEVVAQYIDQHYVEDLTLKELAVLVQFNPSYLSRIFRERSGETIRDRINRKRIEQAFALLRDPDRKIRDIAIECGFNTLSHFHRIFKKYSGSTPTRVRENS